MSHTENNNTENIFSVLANHSNRLGEIFAIVMQLSSKVSALESKIEKIQYLQDKIDSLQNNHKNYDKTMLYHKTEIERQQKLIEQIHIDLQKLGSVKSHILTACAALGGGLATWLIHNLIN